MNKTLAESLARSALKNLRENHADSLEWAQDVGPHTFRGLKAKGFLSEYCWVVYASGFRFAVVQAKFPALRQVFKYFDLEALSRMRSLAPALAVFNNRRKAECFLSGAKTIAEEGFAQFKHRLSSEGLDALEGLPGIGPITKFHLPKNIGLADVAKPDIWLERAAKLCRATTVRGLTSYLAEAVGESQHIVDIAIWHYGVDGLLSRKANKALEATRKLPPKKLTPRANSSEVYCGKSRSSQGGEVR